MTNDRGFTGREPVDWDIEQAVAVHDAAADLSAALARLYDALDNDDLAVGEWLAEIDKAVRRGR